VITDRELRENYEFVSRFERPLISPYRRQRIEAEGARLETLGARRVEADGQ